MATEKQLTTARYYVNALTMVLKRSKATGDKIVLRMSPIETQELCDVLNLLVEGNDESGDIGPIKIIGRDDTSALVAVGAITTTSLTG